MIFIVQFIYKKSSPNDCHYDAFFYCYEPHYTKVNKNIQDAKLTFLEEIRDIQNCISGTQVSEIKLLYREFLMLLMNFATMEAISSVKPQLKLYLFTVGH